MEKMKVSSILIVISAFLILLLSISFLSMEEGVAHFCMATTNYPSCYPYTGLSFSIFGLVICLVLLAAAYHVRIKGGDIAIRWSIIAMVAGLLAYEVTEFAYLSNIISPYYVVAGQMPQFTITIGYFGTMLAFLGGILGLTSIKTKQIRKPARKATRKSVRKRKR